MSHSSLCIALVAGPVQVSHSSLCIALVAGPVHVSHSSLCIALVTGPVYVPHSSLCIALATGPVHVSHSSLCSALATGPVHVSHSPSVYCNRFNPTLTLCLLHWVLAHWKCHTSTRAYCIGNWPTEKLVSHPSLCIAAITGPLKVLPSPSVYCNGFKPTFTLSLLHWVLTSPLEVSHLHLCILHRLLAR